MTLCHRGGRYAFPGNAIIYLIRAIIQRGFMFTRSIKCEVCGFKGKIEAHDTVGKVPASEIFKLLGKDPSTGMIHFRCPSCKEDFAVNPTKFISARKMLSHPQPFSLFLFLGKMLSGSAFYFLWYHKTTISAFIAAYIYFRKQSFGLFVITVILCLIQAFTHRAMNVVAEKYRAEGVDPATAVQLIPDSLSGVNMISSVGIGIVVVISFVKLF